MTSADQNQELSKLHDRIVRLRRQSSNLKQSIAQLRAGADLSGDLFGDQQVCAYWMEPDGTIVAASQALVRLLGYASVDELRARRPDDDEYDAAYVQAMFARNGGQVTDVESVWRRKDGSIVHVRESARANYDAQGRPISYEGIIEEIAGPEQAETPRPRDAGALAEQRGEREQEDLERVPASPERPADMPLDSGSHAAASPAAWLPESTKRGSDIWQLENVSNTNQQVERSTVRSRRYAMSLPAAPQVAPPAGNLERPVLKQYAALLWRWAWLIVLSAALGGAAAYGVSSQSVPVYAASTTLLLNQAATSAGTPDYGTLLAGEMLAKTYAELLRKRPVMEEVAANLKLAGDPDVLAGQIKVSAVRDTQLIVLTVEDTDPQRAADIANQTAEVFGRYNRSLQTDQYVETKQSLERELTKVQLDIDRTQAGLADLKAAASPADIAERDRLQALLAQYRDSYATLLRSLGDVQLAEVQGTNTLKVVEPARPEIQPVRPRTMGNTLLAAIVGMMLGAVTALLIEYLDDRVKSGEQAAELTGAMTLGTIGRIQETGPRNTLVAIRNARSPVAEAYRMLRVNLDFSAIDRPLRTIAVTSSGPAEGKTTTIANLAVTIAQTGKRVILVDTDLRRPTLHKVFEMPNERGVTTALLNPGQGGLKSHLLRVGVRNLLLMPCGPIPPNPAELLSSQRMAQLIEELKVHADVVLFDTPPLLVFADAAQLASSCDGTLLVARAGFTRTGALARAREQIAQAGARLLGVVLNRAAMPRGGYDTYYYYYTEKGAGRRKSRRARKHAQPSAPPSPSTSSGYGVGIPPSSLEYIDFNEGVAPADGDLGVAGLGAAYEPAALPALAKNGTTNGHTGNGHDAQELADAAGAPVSAASKWRVIYPAQK